ERTVAAPQQGLWALLNDPQVLMQCIPGCNTVNAIGEDRYEMGLKLQVGSVSGSYLGTVALRDKREPEFFVLEVEGEGSIGFMKGSARFELAPVDEASTTIKYEGSGEVGGVVAGVGQRVLSGVAKFLVGQFFKALDKQVAAPR
ncbi:MAG TPA: carbon monoxide dehydrogenase subunit G, partial [Burkholderiales bacterium]|nr:carbon monoxide dehydrogenase subunit G [Burkholderiales bacterium]